MITLVRVSIGLCVRYDDSWHDDTATDTCVLMRAILSCLDMHL